MASGSGGQIAFAHIASLGAQVNTLDVWTGFKSENLEHKLIELEEGSMTGRRDAPESHKGIDHGDGDITIEPNPNALSHILKGFFGTVTSSLYCDATSVGTGVATGSYWHKFTPRIFGHSQETFLDPFNIAVYKDVGSAFLYRGAIFPTLKFEINAGALAAVTASVMARQVDLTDYTPIFSANLHNPGGRPWVWDMASVEVSTTGVTSAALFQNVNFEKLGITLAMPQEGVVNLDGTKLYHEFSPNDYRRITFEGTLSFRNMNEYLAFREYEDRRLRVTLLNVNSALILGNPSSADATKFEGYYGLRFNFPRFKFLKYSNPMQGPNRITASFTAKAQLDDTEGASSFVEMNNIVSSTDLMQQH
jgi:hypothetical protein